MYPAATRSVPLPATILVRRMAVVSCLLILGLFGACSAEKKSLCTSCTADSECESGCCDGVCAEDGMQTSCRSGTDEHFYYCHITRAPGPWVCTGGNALCICDQANHGANCSDCAADCTAPQFPPPTCCYTTTENGKVVACECSGDSGEYCTQRQAEDLLYPNGNKTVVSTCPPN
jgi:hypothetical protein